MSDTKAAQDGGIVFGDWKLFPVDDRNWELCHRHEVGKGKNKGEVRWNRLGRFYSYNTFDLAVQYAADVELKAKAEGSVMELHDALAAYRTIIDMLKADVLDAMREVA